jgi:hypothetical protein
MSYSKSTIRTRCASPSKNLLKKLAKRFFEGNAHLACSLILAKHFSKHYCVRMCSDVRKQAIHHIAPDLMEKKCMVVPYYEGK